MKNKHEIRRQIWEALEKEGVVRFPGAKGRIPNYDRAVDCARRLDEVPVWQKARVIKCNPDYAQVAARARAFHEGKVLYVAVPRLRSPRCFFELDPAEIDVSPWQVVSIRGSIKYGRTVSPEEMRPVDLILCGSVAVTRDGARVGKGGGYSDLEYALGRSYGFVREETPTLTTVHPLQVLSEEVEIRPHDFPLDWIVTPDEVVQTRTGLPRPLGVRWDLLEPGKLEKIPALKRLRRKQGIRQGQALC